jgi:hypothetical protein
MKKIILIILIFTFNSCKPQASEEKKPQQIIHKNTNLIHDYNKLNNKKMEKFDIEKFNKNKDESENYNYVLENNIAVEEFGYEGRGYFRKETSKNSLFTIYKEFYFNGFLKKKGQSYKYGSCQLGIWYEYDEKGNLLSTIDTDKPFVITFEDIVIFCKKNKANIETDSYTNISRNNDEVTNASTWTIRYTGKYEEKPGKFIVILDGKTGSIIKVTQMLGKNGENKIIYDKKITDKGKQKIFTTHKGKNYTEEE